MLALLWFYLASGLIIVDLSDLRALPSTPALIGSSTIATLLRVTVLRFGGWDTFDMLPCSISCIYHLVGQGTTSVLQAGVL